MDTLGIEPRAFRMRSGCDTTTPCALCLKLQTKTPIDLYPKTQLGLLCSRWAQNCKTLQTELFSLFRPDLGAKAKNQKQKQTVGANENSDKKPGRPLDRPTDRPSDPPPAKLVMSSVTVSVAWRPICLHVRRFASCQKLTAERFKPKFMTLPPILWPNKAAP